MGGSHVFQTALCRCSSADDQQQDQRSESLVSVARSVKSRSEASFSRIHSWSTTTSFDEVDERTKANSTTSGSSPASSSNYSDSKSSLSHNSFLFQPQSDNSSSQQSFGSHENNASIPDCFSVPILVDPTSNATEIPVPEPPSEVILHLDAIPYAQLCFKKHQQATRSTLYAHGDGLGNGSSRDKEERRQDPELGVKIVEPVQRRTESGINIATTFLSSSSSSEGSGWSTGDDETTTDSSGGGSKELLEAFLWFEQNWYYQATEAEDIFVLEQQALLCPDDQPATSDSISAAVAVTEVSTGWRLWSCCKSRVLGTLHQPSPTKSHFREFQKECRKAKEVPLPTRLYRYVTLDD